MADKTLLRYNPDYAVPPGETLQETIETLGLTQAQLAARTGHTAKMINEIIRGKAPITADTAIQLERVLGVPASFWNNLESNYRADLARLREWQTLQDQLGWLDRIPLKAMVKLNWVKPRETMVEQLQEVLDFFGVASPAAWDEIWDGAQVAYRKSAVFESDPGAVAAWLRKGEIEAQRMECSDYGEERFRNALTEVRRLTTEPPSVFVPELKLVCAKAGVAVVFVSELQGTHVSGATRWLTPRKALIQLSLRYKTDDHLWFTFFHEASHILKHGKTAVFLEGDNAEDPREKEADGYARDWLIPSAEYARLPKRPTFLAIKGAALRLGVAPGIIVGRLQHDGVLSYRQLNTLKRRFCWAKE